MTQRSRFWNGTSVGDATEAAYDAPTEFAQVLMALAGASALTHKSGIWRGVGIELIPSSPSANTVRTPLGAAQVYGSWYENDANVDTNIPTPASSTRIDLIVLRKDWAAQTIRITRIAGAEGGGAPALVQTIGTTWDMPVAQVSITTGAVITITDQRRFIRPLPGLDSRVMPLANGTSGVLALFANTFDGWVMINIDNGYGALYYIRGGLNGVYEGLDPANMFSPTRDNAGTINPHWHGAASRYELQNMTGADRIATIHYFVS